MDEELISKKELLETFGISYGALYRWKRMGLIPEAWFLRRSTSTGQETFLKRPKNPGAEAPGFFVIASPFGHFHFTAQMCIRDSPCCPGRCTGI